MIIEVAVALMLAQAIVIHRLAGVAYPLWAGSREPPA